MQDRGLQTRQAEGMIEQEEIGMEQTQVLQQVGYHDLFHLGYYEAIDRVQQSCPEGWRAGATRYSAPPGELPNDPKIPEGALRVGQFRIRQGDPEYVLYIYKV